MFVFCLIIYLLLTLKLYQTIWLLPSHSDAQQAFSRRKHFHVYSLLTIPVTILIACMYSYWFFLNLVLIIAGIGILWLVFEVIEWKDNLRNRGVN